MGFCSMVVILIKRAFCVIRAFVTDTNAVSPPAASFPEMAALEFTAVAFFELPAVCTEISRASVI